MQGQIDGLRASVQVSEEDIIHLDSKNVSDEARKAVAAILPALRTARHVVVLGINDEVIMGTLSAFEEAGGSERVVAVGQGADQAARRELSRSGSRMIGSVAFFPEYYGNLIINLALQILQGKQVAPAVYTDHILVLSEHSINTLDLSTFPYEHISGREYGKHRSSRSDLSSLQRI
jgi:ribose transport system substrate-binding protein